MVQLIDTSAWVEWLRPKGNAEVGNRVDAALRAGEAAICEMVWLELWNGARAGSEQKTLRSMEATLLTLETGESVWQAARALAKQARSKGVSVPASDILIFSCARHHGATVLHFDGDFRLLDGVVAG